MTFSAPNQPSLVVVGNGMVGHRFVQAAIAHGLHRTHRVSVFAEEARLAYDRVNLSKFFNGKTAEDLCLVGPDEYESANIRVIVGNAVASIDTVKRTVTASDGTCVPYDRLVLATGSRPFVPDIKGRDLPGCFVYRTIDDLVAIRSYAARCRRGVVIGGGLLGLEAAGALQSLGLETHVVEFASRLMPLQVDDAGAAVLRSRIEALGVSIHLERVTQSIEPSSDGHVKQLVFSDASELETDLVVFSAGIRPRDELARSAGLEVGSRGGIVVDARCLSSAADVFAIGECALANGKVYGLAAPGYRMAEVAAANIAGEPAMFDDFDMSTKLKLLGVDVGSFGDAFGRTPASKTISLFDGAAGVYKKLVLSGDLTLILGGMLVGDASAYSQLLAYVQNGIRAPQDPETLLVPPKSGASAGLGLDALPETATICSCHNVTKGKICKDIVAEKLMTLGAVKAHTKAGTGCGSCSTLVDELLKAELKRSGVVVYNYICEHFKFSRQELYHLVRTEDIKTFDELVERHGTGDGCEICKPAVASILASVYNDHVLAREHVALQDTNDRFLANIQKDGTYSVVPRVAAGEITPDQLIAIGNVAKKYALYTKITGGQRIDLFGARVEQLPLIWQELIAAGFESGHAYGKALRTVKSCVGSTWCRFGVQDSVGLALRLEHRYKGLRSPHKLKGAVSGCARECAEAQGKDFGIIATENGYNLYVCGNGGMKPQHAQLLVADADADRVIQVLDRFLMFYVRTADRLQRTATWLNKLEGGLEYLKQVILDDSLGICAELEAQMAYVVTTYQCEWKSTLSDPEKLKLFRAFVNTDRSDPSVVVVSERGQHRPATTREKQSHGVSGRRELPVIQSGP
ncbi:MAG TPA: nitrite reductase large subunit NirB [Polyangiaceae bacterium]